MTSSNDDNGNSVPVDQRRITPDELSAAVAALEIKRAEAERKRAEEEKYLSETIPIRQAIDDLRLDASSEELWHEVQAQRQQRSAQGQPIIQQTQSIHKTFQPDSPPASTGTGALGRNISIAVLGTALLTYLITTYFSHPLILGQQFSPLHPSPAIPYRPPFVAETLDAAFYHKLALSRGPHPVYRITEVFPFYSPSQQQDISEVTAYPIRAIPDGYTVYYAAVFSQPPDLDANGTNIYFKKINSERLPADTSFKRMLPYQPFTYLPFTRYNGRTYFECWIQKTSISAVRDRQAFSLYLSSAPSPGQTGLIPFSIPMPGDSMGFYGAHEQLWQQLAAPQRGIYRRAVRTAWIPPGMKIPIGSHSFEDFSSAKLPPYHPPKWVQQPGALGDSSYNPNASLQDYDTSSRVELLSDISNGQVIHCNAEIVSSLSAETQETFYLGRMPMPWSRYVASSSIVVDARPDFYRPCTLVRLGGHLYLRAWVPGPFTAQEVHKKKIGVFLKENNPLLGMTPTPIQIRIHNSQMQAMYDSTITVNNLHLDQYAWQKW